MTVTEAWALLGLAPTDDGREVKRAYSRLLKQLDVERDRGGFNRLREALELALAWGARIPEWETAGDGYWDEQEEALPEGEGQDFPAMALDAFGGAPVFPSFAGGGEWRPQGPPAGNSALAAAARALDTLLFDPEPVAAERIEAAGAALLAALDAAPVGEAAAIEHWLLSALAASIPRSDPLIEPAMAHFGWDNAVRPRDYMFSFDLDTLQDRRADSILFARILSYGEERDRRAIEELRRSGRVRVGPFELALAGDVRHFLDGPLAAHPMMEHDLQADSLAFWRGYFERRHLPDFFWLQLFAIPPALTFAVAIGFVSAGVPAPLSAVPGYLIALVATLAGIFAFAELRACAAARDRSADRHGYRSRRAELWLLAGLALPPAAALAVSSIWTALACNLAALALAIGGLLTTRPPRRVRSESAVGPAAVSGTALIASATVLLGVPSAVAAQLAGPLAAMCYLAYRGHEAASISLGAIERRTALLTIAAAGLFAAAAIVPLIAFIPGLPPPIWLALVPAAVAAQHFATAPAYLATGLVEWASRVAGILFYFTAGKALFETDGQGLIAAILLYVLVYSVVRTILAARQLPRRGEEPPAYF